MDNSAVICDKVIDVQRTMAKRNKNIPTNFNENKATCKMQILMKLHMFTLKNPKLGSNHTSLAVIDFHSSLKQIGNYYPQVFLEKKKYIEKKAGSHSHDKLSNFFYFCDEFDEDCNSYSKKQS